MSSKPRNEDCSTVDKTALIYPGAEITRSLVGRDAIVGNFSRVIDSEIKELVKIDRNNLVMKSRIGKLSYSGNFVVVQSSEIGSFCSISWGVSVGGGEHDMSRISSHDFLYNKRYGLDVVESDKYNRYSEECTLKNDVWVGANSTVLRGVTVGNGAVIGAGSVVTKDVPDYAVVVGNPARVIKYRFSDAVIERLLKLSWWDMDYEILKQNAAVFHRSDVESVLSALESL